MGRYGARVGKFYAEYGDYQWDYIKQNKPLEYYQNQTLKIEVENIETGQKEIVEVPIIDNFIDVTLIKKNYNFRHISGNTLLVWLFNYVKQKERIFCKPFIQTTWKNDYTRKWKEFFLDSPLRFPIVLKENTDNIIELKDIEDLFWLQNNGLTMVDWCDEKGKVYEN